MYGAYGGYGQKKSSASDLDIPQWKRSELLDQLGGATKTGANLLLDALSVPGSLIYDVLEGKSLGSGSTGADVLDSFGLLPNKKTMGGWARPLSTFAFEATTDPLNLLTLGGGAASKATRAARAAGIADDATRVASRRLMNDAAKSAKRSGRAASEFIDAAGSYAKSSRQAFEKMGKGLEDITDADLMSRPLVGSRRAARSTTLEDLIKAQGKGADEAARRSVDDYLKRYNLKSTDIGKQTIGNDIGFGLGDWQVAGKFGDITRKLGIGDGSIADAFGDAIAGGLDRTGQWMRWTAGGRAAHAAFNPKVLGAYEEGDQILARAVKASDDLADKAARHKVADIMQAIPTEGFTPAVSRAVRSTIEGVASTADKKLVSESGLDATVKRLQKEFSDYLEKSGKAGISNAKLTDPYGLGYFPRSLDSNLYEGGRVPVDGNRMTAVNAGDQMARADAYKMPGGTQQVREISQNKAIRDKATDEEAAELVYKEANKLVKDGMPEYTMDSARKLAKDIRATKDGALDEVGFFDNNFMEDFSRYARSRERSMGRANLLMDELVATASTTKASAREGTGYIGLQNAAHTLGLKGDGMRDGLLDRLKAKGFDVSDLKNISIDGRTLRRLSRVNDFFTVPEMPGKVLKFLDDITRLWKSSILSWNARFTRDRYSGAFTNLLEVGSPSDLYRGSVMTQRLIQGQFDELSELLVGQSMASGKYPDYVDAFMASGKSVDDYMQNARTGVAAPRYVRELLDAASSGLSAEQGYKKVIESYRNDLAAEGLLKGRRIEDIGMEVNGRASGESLRDELLPGATPRTTWGYKAADLLSGNAPKVAPQTASAELLSGKGYAAGLSNAVGAMLPDPKYLPMRSAVDAAGKGIGNALDSMGLKGFREGWDASPRKFTEWLGDNKLKDPVLRWANKLGDVTDSMNRLDAYNGLLLQGVSPQEAARRAMAAQVDYTLTEVERSFFRRLAPFWSFNSRMGYYVAQKIWNKPGGAFTQLGLRLPQTISESAEESGYTPKEIKESYGFNLEPLRNTPGIGSIVDLIAPTAEGKQSYLKDIDLPGIDLINLAKIQRGADGSIAPLSSIYETSLNAVSGLAHPYIRTGVEQLSGRNLYTDQALSQFEPTLQKLGRRMGVQPLSAADDILRWTAAAAEQIPHAPRVLQLANRLADSERTPEMSARAIQALINASSGVKIRNILDDAASMDARREIEAMLNDSPTMRTFESRYLPEELRPYASPEELMLYDLSRVLNKEARDAREKRNKGMANPYLP